MKRTLVLIVILLITNSFTLLAQTNKAGSAASKKAAAKKTAAAKQTSSNDAALLHAIQKRQADSLAAVKTAQIAAEKVKSDSVAKLTGNNLTPAVPAVIPARTSKTDTTSAKKKNKKDAKKDKASKAVTDSLWAKIKSVKPKSAKQLKKDSIKNDINNLSEAAIAKIGFKTFGSDSAFKAALNKPRPDIPFTNARPLPLIEQTVPNIKFYHRYWRDIDLANPKNKQLATYHATLISMLLASIKNKELKAYNPAIITADNPGGDAFTSVIPYDQLISGLSDTSVVNILDKNGNITGSKLVPNPFTPEKIAGYRIKEDVYYDKVHSQTITRIIGIAPLVKLTLSSGEVLSVQPLCWLRFKDCRMIFVTIDTDPTKKVGTSLDDIFLQRRFYGKIVQESNPEGKRIKDYKTEVADQDAEAARIEQKLNVFKKGSWNYTMLTPEPKQRVVNNRPAAIPKPPKANNAPPVTAKP